MRNKQLVEDRKEHPDQKIDRLKKKKKTGEKKKSNSKESDKAGIDFFLMYRFQLSMPVRF